MAWNRKLSSSLTRTAHAHRPRSDFQNREVRLLERVLKQSKHSKVGHANVINCRSLSLSLIQVKCRKWQKYPGTGKNVQVLPWGEEEIPHRRTVWLMMGGQNSTTLLLTSITSDFTTRKIFRPFKNAATVCSLLTYCSSSLLHLTACCVNYYFHLSLLDSLVSISTSKAIFKATLP